MTTISLGTVYEPHPREVAELSQAILSLTGEEPERRPIQGFAGPNDVVQILIDAATWPKALGAFGLLLGGKFAISFVSELGKRSAAEVWKNRENYAEALRRASAAPFKRLIEAIAALRQRDQTVTIAVWIPGTQRNAGLVITSEDPVEIIWEISNVARCAPQILEIVQRKRDASPYGEVDGRNPDSSIQIEIAQDGSISILGEVIP
ncbi:MAG: hypothetical protein KF817_08675 [Phycisphaeraceae bacterium]|nr:hypothetical protein [Phycisphaeraceae bacterium]